MSNFRSFADSFYKNFSSLSKDDLFTVSLDRDQVFEAYLSSFPEGTNPLVKERSYHDCSCCRHFIRQIGHVVSIKNGVKRSVWDIEGLEYPYNIVAEAIADLVYSAPINSHFFINERKVGLREDKQLLSDGTIRVNPHFYADIPNKFYTKDVDAKKGFANTSRNVLQRSFDEFKSEAFDDVLDLIQQNILYRGAEFKKSVEDFYSLFKKYSKPTNGDKSLLSWELSVDPISRFRNTAIGTLIQDISSGIDLEKAVKSFESKVAPANYKRPRALVTEKMIKDAISKIEKMGIRSSLDRRFAKISDISPVDVLFVDNSAAPLMKDPLMDSLLAEAKRPSIKEDNATDISIEDFMEVVKRSTSLEAFVSNSHVGNLFSLTAPQDIDSKNIFQWDNGFAWSYNGEMADSDIRSKVAAAGGRVDGVFRFSHSWNHRKRNASLMDLHVFLPKSSIGPRHGDKPADKYGNKERVGWNFRKHSRTGGVQDVDYTDPAPAGYVPVENITFPDLSRLDDGDYVCKIHNWQERSPNEGGFKAEIECGGQVYEYEYDKYLRHKEWVTVAVATLKNGEWSVKHEITPESSSKSVWGINTQSFVKVKTLLNSPNHWHGSNIGNKHWFFVLDNCVNPDKARGIYNEFLSPEFSDYRKVFELLGQKTKCEKSDEQLSGVGFSSTKRDSILIKAYGEQNRLWRVKF